MSLASDPLAGPDVEPGEQEEDQGDHHVDDVHHRSYLASEDRRTKRTTIALNVGDRRSSRHKGDGFRRKETVRIGGNNLGGAAYPSSDPSQFRGGSLFT
jgi:hypothetical protein